jgi:hypothetical protein
VTPRPGGEADKLGNRYEAAWTIHHALFCLGDPRYALIVEDVDPELNNGSEFTFHSGARVEVHQLKRSTGSGNSWSLSALATQGVLAAAAAHVAAGRDYHFVSSVPCGDLQELADRARKSTDADDFAQRWLNKRLRSTFDELTAKEYFGSAEIAWSTLRGMWFQVQTETDVVRSNSVLAASRLQGATGHLVALAIHDVLLDTLGQQITKDVLEQRLAEHGIEPVSTGSTVRVRDAIESTTSGWLTSVQSELLQPVIQRAEADALVEALGERRLCLVAGTAGGGKSAVLEQAVAKLQQDGAPVLALRLDRLESFATTIALGRQLGLDTSPAAALATISDGGSAYLVIDQLDAVSLASGRMPTSFDVVSSLVAEALSVPGIKVIIACREFDIDNDHRIRAMASRKDLQTIKVGTLTDAEVNQAVEAMGLDAGKLVASQRALLKTPVHLVLLSSIAGQPDALAFQSKGSLFEAFWERKRQASDLRRPGIRFSSVISRVANAASDRQALSVPIEILDDDDLRGHADVLVSEHVLARDGDRIAFFHESFFDYAFARQWISRGESMVEFLTRDEQELFRRGQVRQILQHLREREPSRFHDELEALLTSDQIRFHVKEAALAVLGSLSNLGPDDTSLVVRVADGRPNFEERLWQQVRRPSWFAQFNADGYVTAWLDGTDERRRKIAASVLSVGAIRHADEVAGILSARRSNPDHTQWLRLAVRQADIHTSRAMFDSLLDALKQGLFDDAEHELWLAAHDLADHQPLWAVELLEARFVTHPNALALNDSGKVADLELREYTASEMVKKTSAAEPHAFAAAMIPYLREAVEATLTEPREGRPLRDKHFMLRWPAEDMEERDLDDAILAGCVRALGQLAALSPDEARPFLQDLASDPYDTSQYVLYQALIQGARNFSEWAAELLLEGGARLDCGYASDADWVARELARAIAPIVSAETHERLEALFRDLRSPYESRESNGLTAFTFLSGLDPSRLTPEGQKRLEEHRRKFKRDEPSAPRGITGGAVNSPISEDAAKKMSDDQWLRAISRYDSDEHDWGTLKGGARELSSSLRVRVAADPDRFARLALQLTADMYDAYGDAVLMGLGDGRAAEPENAYAAIRHIASLGHSSNDRWLGMALRKYYKDAPLDLVALVLDRAMHSPDPADNKPVMTRGDGDGRRAEDLRMNGINTARGSLAEALGNLLINDVDGARTELVEPHLQALAGDTVLSVRSCVAHTLSASLRHARPAVLPAFDTLIDTDDVLLAAQLVLQLMLYIGNVDPEVITPVIDRMLASDNDEVRDAGGQIATFAGLEWQKPELLTKALQGDERTRTGVARILAARVDRTSNSELAAASLTGLMNDDTDSVREAVAKVAPHLRDQALRPFEGLLTALIESKAYEHATPQLLLTLQHAPDRVDHLVLLAAQRFLGVFGEQASDIRTGAAGDAHYVSELVVRGLAQSRDRTHRTALLDILDELMLRGVYGIDDAIAKAERL